MFIIFDVSLQVCITFRVKIISDGDALKNLMQKQQVNGVFLETLMFETTIFYLRGVLEQLCV